MEIELKTLSNVVVTTTTTMTTTVVVEEIMVVVVEVCRCGSAHVSINEVNRRRARLVLEDG